MLFHNGVMIVKQKKYTIKLVALGLLLFSQATLAVRFEPGIGVGTEYTDNAKLTDKGQTDDVIAVGYLGAKIIEDEGALTYNAATAYNSQHYTSNTFSDQNNFSLAAVADWEMVKDRFNWFLNDRFSQRTIRTINSNTPNNVQDTNVFTFGANIRMPVSARQNFSLVPQFNQYYYKTLTTDNKQYSLAGSWQYQMFRLTNVGLNLNVREVNYTGNTVFGQPINDSTFTNAALVISSKRSTSTVTANLGATRAKRDGGNETTGFTGSLGLLQDLSSRSSFQAQISSDITDTSSAGVGLGNNTDDNIEDDVQAAADVIRNSVVNLVYSRKDASLNTRISARYNNIDYSESPLDRVIRSFGMALRYPITPLLSSGVYADYNRTKQVDTARLDKRYAVGGNVLYQLSRKLKMSFDLKYRTKDSPVATQDYNEFSVFASITYGFGNVQRPSSTGG